MFHKTEVSGKGSFWKTSNIAVAIHFFSKALTKLDSSMTLPRPTLIKMQEGLQLDKTLSDKNPMVSGVWGRILDYY